MTVLQAFFDESGKQSDHPLIAVCCVCGMSTQINEFDAYWRALLEKHSVSDLHMKRDHSQTAWEKTCNSV